MRAVVCCLVRGFTSDVIVVYPSRSAGGRRDGARQIIDKSY